MKVSTKWLQNYFDEKLPNAQALADAFTFHSFEVEEQEGDLLDLKVLPDRACYALCHRGAAAELATALGRPLRKDPLREPLPGFPQSKTLTIEIENPKKCSRYIGAVVKGVKIGPSPAWLKEALEAVGQRSINNVVDATNYMMLDIGQPLHAFDTAKLMQKGKYTIGVRNAKAGEKVTALSGETYELSESTLLIVDANADVPIGIAGVKGGKAAEISAATTDIIIEAANFDGSTIRRAAQKLKLFTDASLRFQNRPSPELAAYGMRDVLALIREVAGGEVEGIVDEYPTSALPASIKVSLADVNGLLGSDFPTGEVETIFRRLRLSTEVKDDVFTVTPPFERTDLVIPEDLIEEVGRIAGYERIPAVELPAVSGAPDQARYRGTERMKDQLVEQGFTEVSTQSFVQKGDLYLANPLDKARPALRTSLEENLADALARAKHYAPLVLPPNVSPRLFEVGTVFPKAGEYLELRMTETVPAWGDNFPTVDNLTIAKLDEYGKEYSPKRYELGAFKPFSQYPFIARDIALWVPVGTDAAEIEKTIRNNAGELLVRLDQFDQFEKEGRISYAFRLVFESMERTLTDDEVNAIMKTISGALAREGYEVR